MYHSCFFLSHWVNVPPHDYHMTVVIDMIIKPLICYSVMWEVNDSVDDFELSADANILIEGSTRHSLSLVNSYTISSTHRIPA